MILGTPRKYSLLQIVLEGGNFVIAPAAIWIVLGIVLVIGSFAWPETVSGWVVAIIIMPPIQILGEAAIEGFHSIPMIRNWRRSISNATVNQKFSTKRIACLLIETSLVISLVILAISVVQKVTGWQLNQ